MVLLFIRNGRYNLIKIVHYPLRIYQGKPNDFNDLAKMLDNAAKIWIIGNIKGQRHSATAPKFGGKHYV
jgi:hypothetical protein